MLPPKHKPQEDNVDSWLMSYADMITLLLGFFIIFVSISEPKKAKLNAIREGVSGQFGVVELSTPFQGVYRTLEGVVERNQVPDEVAVEATDKSLTLELSTLAFFEGKSVGFDEARRPLLLEIIKEIKAVDYLDTTIIIEAHTNDIPPDPLDFASNWDLSAARAAHMVRFFIENGIPPQRLRAVGYGDSRPKVPNEDVNGNAIPSNQDQNERILVRIERNF